MRRLLALWWHYFSWQRTLTVTTLLGLGLFLIGLLAFSGPGRETFVLLGAVLGAGFPILLAGLAYRLLISNRHLLLLPRFRPLAATALLLFALTITALVVLTAGSTSPDGGAGFLARIGLLAFAVISAYLLLSQLLVGYRSGVIAVVLIPLVLIGLSRQAPAVLTLPLVAFVGLAAAALLGWVWLGIVARMPAPPRRSSATAVQSSAPPGSELQGYMPPWVPTGAAPASAPGSMLRGLNDAWRNRILLVLVSLVGVPVCFWLMVLLLRTALASPEQGPFSWTFFLVWSSFVLGLQMLMTAGEWPARLRLLWLRMPGARREAWQFLERSLFGDAAIVAAGTSLIAVILYATTDTPPNHLATYVAGTTALGFVSAYAAFWMRAAHWHRIAQTLFAAVGIMSGIFVIGISRAADTPIGGLKLLLILAALALGFRHLARRRIARIDWLAVRPFRMPRRII